MRRSFFLLLILIGCSQKEDSKKTIQTANSQANPYYEKAFVFMDKNADSSFFYLNQAKELFQKRNDSFGLGKTYVNMAIIQEKAGDNFGSVETSLLATKFLKEKHPSHCNVLFSNYNNLGVASNNLKNYQDAKRFYQKAYRFTKDPVDRMMLANNLAIVFHNEKQYQKAVAIYAKLLDSVGARSEFYPKLLLNYSRSRWYGDRAYHPKKNYLKAEKLSETMKDDWTKDAAYAYLSDFYLDKDNDSAKLYATKMLNLATRLKYPDDQLEALKTLIKISQGSDSKKYFETYSNIQDELITSQNKAKNQFALIRFESEKAKAENLHLQKEKTMIEYKVLRQKIINASIVGFVFIVTVFVFLWIKRKRQRMILEANNKLQNQRLDFSKKVHDVVANGIYEVMSTIENQGEIPKEKILDKLELMYEKSRDLSYENVGSEEFNEQMSGLINSFDKDETKIIVIGNDPDFWRGLNQFSKDQLFQIIRELLINAKKHSQATQILLRFLKDNDLREINYNDNGVGLPKDFSEKNGLTNIRSRLKEINAKLEIKGTLEGLKMIIKL
ncbi:MAG: tetratricopeptide repeat protein [Weeksellaceae bacterium]|nr:tetratricopeptide repeat protein [Weeksellaceae bacterium]